VQKRLLQTIGPDRPDLPLEHDLEHDLELVELFLELYLEHEQHDLEHDLEHHDALLALQAELLHLQQHDRVQHSLQCQLFKMRFFEVSELLPEVHGPKQNCKQTRPVCV